MFANFRKRLGTGIMLVILLIGLIAIVVTGFGTDGMGGLGGATGASAQTVARVGDRRLTDTDINAIVDGRYRQLLREQPTLDRGAFVDGQFDDLFGQVLNEAAMAEWGRELGFVVADRMVDRAIVNLGFLNAAGQFDEASFRRALQQQGISERQLREDLGRGEIIRMVLAPVGGEIRVPRTVAMEYASLFLEQRQGTLGAVPTEAIARNLQPNDQEIAQYYQRNSRAFAVPERRVLRYAVIGRDHFGAAVTATDQEIATYYQENQAQYGPGETRNLQRIVLPDEAAARAFVQRVQGGMSFTAAAGQAGFAPSDINFAQQSRAQFTTASTPEVAGQAFGAQQGALVGPIRTDLGFQVVRVEAIDNIPGRPLQAVRSEIVTAVEARKLADAVNGLVDRVEQRLAEGESFEEVTQAERIAVQTTPALTADGNAPGVQGSLPDQPYRFPEPLMPLVQAAFAADDEQPTVEVLQPDVQAALVSLGNTVPPATPPLAQIRNEVRARLIAQTALQRGRALADGIVNRINGGMPPAQAYAQAGLPGLPPPRPISLRRLQIATPGQAAPPPLRLLFSIPQGRARVMPAPNGAGWIIVHHQTRTAGNAAADPRGAEMATQAQQEFSQIAGPELAEQFGRAVAATLTVTREEDRITALRQRLRTGQ